MTGFYFAMPWALLLLVFAWLIWHRHQAGIALRTPWRRGLALALRLLVFVLVVLALADPRWQGQSTRQHVAWVVDVSRSVGTSALERARTFAREASKASAFDSDGWILFAGQSRAINASSAKQTDDEKPTIDLPPEQRAALDPDATNIEQALQVADLSAPRGHAKTIVLFTDGKETDGDIIEQVEALRQRNLSVLPVVIPPPDQPEVLVRSLRAPGHVTEDTPFALVAEIESNREGKVMVDLFRNGTRIGETEVAVQPGVTRFETTQRVAGERLFEFSLGVRSTNDTLSGNNEASAVVQTEGKSKVLLISDKPRLSRYLSLALKQEGILLDARPPAGAPQTLADLQNYDLLVLDNVPATDVTPRQMELMASYVRDFGGGLLMLGGDNAFGLGGYFQTAVEEMLPVRCDFEKEKENPSLALALVVDKSGSMNGLKIEMAKDAARAAVELLSNQDQVGVVAFDGQALWVVDMQSASDRFGVARQIASIQPGGGTSIAPALELAYSGLSAARAKLKHVILLTDGVSAPPPGGSFYELTSRMAQDRITVSTVAVGTDSDQRLLEQIATWGNGRYYFTDNPQNIPQIFARETMTASKSALQEVPFVPVAARPVDFLSGVPLDTAPFLLGYVITQAKPTAEVWLTTERGDPLLATWRFGLGSAGAWTSDARNRWAVEWLRWEGFGPFWGQLVRHLKRPSSLKKFPARIEPEAGGFALTIDTVDERGQFLNDLVGQVVVLDPQQSAAKLPLTLTAPGRMRAWWPAEQRGTYNAQITLRNAAGEPVESQFLSTTRGYPDELRLGPANESILATLAAETGGVVNPAPNAILGKDQRSVAFDYELWPWLLMAALGFFLADVAARRFPERA